MKNHLNRGLGLFITLSLIISSVSIPLPVYAYCRDDCNKRVLWMSGGAVVLGAAAGALAGWAAGHRNNNNHSHSRFITCTNAVLTFTIGSAPIGLNVQATIIAPDGQTQQASLSTSMSTPIVFGPSALAGNYSIIFTVQSGVLAGPASLGNVIIQNNIGQPAVELVAPQITSISQGTQSSLQFVFTCSG